MAFRDIIYFVVIIFILGVAFFLFNYTQNVMFDQVIASPAIQAVNQSVETMEATRDTLNNRMDYMVFGVFIGLILAMLITSWLIAEHPILIVIYLIVIVIGVVLAAILSNTWESVTVASIFGITITRFPITNHIITNMPYYISVVGLISFIIMGYRSNT